MKYIFLFIIMGTIGIGTLNAQENSHRNANTQISSTLQKVNSEAATHKDPQILSEEFVSNSYRYLPLKEGQQPARKKPKEEYISPMVRTRPYDNADKKNKPK